MYGVIRKSCRQLSVMDLGLQHKFLHCLHLKILKCTRTYLTLPEKKTASYIIWDIFVVTTYLPRNPKKFLDLHKSLDACIIYGQCKLIFSRQKLDFLVGVCIAKLTDWCKLPKKSAYFYLTISRTEPHNQYRTPLEWMHKHYMHICIHLRLREIQTCWLDQWPVFLLT